MTDRYDESNNRSDDREISLNHIKTVSNIRTDVGDFSELMSSIKQHGLMQPIGLWLKGKNEYVIVWGNRRLTAIRMLGWSKLIVGQHCVLLQAKDMTEDKYLIMNTIENIQRKEITPAELGKIVKELRSKHNMSYKEISARLSIGENKLRNAEELYHKVPAEFQDNVGYAQGNSDKKGKISADVMKKALAVPIPKAKQQTLFNAIKRENMSGDDIAMIRALVENGMKIEDAINERLNYRAVRLKFTVDKKTATQLETQMKKTMPFIIYDALQHKVNLPKKLFYMEKLGGGACQVGRMMLMVFS